MCRCAERRRILSAAALSAATGDPSRLAPAAGFLLRSMAEDAARALRLVSARARLAR